ncbi:MAG: PAS domain-containing protein [Anaerolineales bacterium]|nr:PAS domain-containing protein [Anaerolineales bacterium]MCB9144246.1 PAS domain-containing protein [Anaerolineales bacterium]
MQATTILYPYALSFFLTFVMGVYTLRYRKHAAGIPFIAMCFFASIWALGYIFELDSTSLVVKVFGVKLGYIGVLGVPLSWTAFSLAYSGRADLLSKRNILLTAAFPALTYIIILTNEYHHWFFTSVGLQTDEISGLLLIKNPLGWWFWLHAAYIYGVLIVGTYFLLHEFWNKRKLYRLQILVNITAVLLPWIANGLVLLGILPIHIDITSITFSISILILGWGFLRYNLLDFLPVAHRSIFESLSEGVIILDTNHRIVEFNPSAQDQFNLTPEQVLGKSFHDVFRPWMQIRDKDIHTHGFHREVVFENEGRPYRWLHLFVSTLRNRAGENNGHIVTLRDVTSIKENESALAIARDEAMQANSFKTQLLANVSHELRTPLGIILGYTDLIARKSYGDLNEKQVSVLDRIKDSTLYLEGLVSELLDQAQLDSGRLQLEERPLEPREVLGSIFRQLSILAESKNLYFRYSITEDLPVSIIADSQRLKQIVVNLISNGIKFTETGGITVEVLTPTPEEWVIRISDTGPGIPPHALNLIFEPFKQLANANKSLRKGYGLGLSITRQLIRLMGGNIIIESEVDKGTTFTVNLPLILAPALENIEELQQET